MTQLDRKPTERNSLPTLDEWLATLEPSQLDLLLSHAADDELPSDVIALLKQGPLSPMQVRNGNSREIVTMAPAVAQALQKLDV